MPSPSNVTTVLIVLGLLVAGIVILPTARDLGSSEPIATLDLREEDGDAAFTLDGADPLHVEEGAYPPEEFNAEDDPTRSTEAPFESTTLPSTSIDEVLSSPDRPQAVEPTISKEQTKAPVERGLRSKNVASGLGEAVMVVLHPLSPDTYFIVGHDGMITRFDVEWGLHPEPAADLRARVFASGESGLHALVFHPLDPTRAFVFYNDAESALILEELTFHSSLDRFETANAKVLLRIPPAHGAHNGGALAFGPDGRLYVSVGDGGEQDDPHGRAQDLNELYGKILRIDVDHVRGAYGIPNDNPFTSLDRSEIWLYGFRNPWRMTFDSATGDLWIADVGGSIAEEIDRHAAGAPAGMNYGWPIWEGSTYRHRGAPDGFDPMPPIHEYRPASGRCAITGGVFYRHSVLAPLKDAYLYSDFCDGILRAFEHTGSEWNTREVMPMGRGVVHILEDHDRTLLILRYGGELSRIIYEE